MIIMYIFYFFKVRIKVFIRKGEMYDPLTEIRADKDKALTICLRFNAFITYCYWKLLLL